ncbi:MAG: hypothetical protein ACE5EV_05560, partial [Gaiellales bacterium]
RPHVNAVMLDTQVYSNTGGQNSDSSTMLGGFDMNQFGRASQGKIIEKKSVAEAFTAGHGSPYVAQVSAANAARLYRAMLEGLEYRGTAFFQCFTTCQPEHGVADDMSAHQAKLIRDSRGMPEFVSDPRGGETTLECLDLKGNPSADRDWWNTKHKASGERYEYTVAHWALTEARFRRHVKAIGDEEVEGLLHLGDMLACITQADVVGRRAFDRAHRSSTSSRRSRGSFATTPSRGSWCSSPSSGARRGASSRAGRDCRTRTTGPRRPCSRRRTPARSPRTSFAGAGESSSTLSAEPWPRVLRSGARPWRPVSRAYAHRTPLARGPWLAGGSGPSAGPA